MLLAYVKAENLKNRHTVASRLFWLVPLFSILLSFVFSGQDSRYYQMNQYNWWYTTFFPMLLLLSTAFAGQRERKMKNRAMGALPINMKTLWRREDLVQPENACTCRSDLILCTGSGQPSAGFWRRQRDLRADPALRQLSCGLCSVCGRSRSGCL